MMDNNLKKELINYYDERAKEYDEVYMCKFPFITESDPYKKEAEELNKKDVKEIIKITSKFGRGDLIDIGCGTGFWLPYYEKNCDAITLVDDSENMFSECRKRVTDLGVWSKCHFIKGDFFTLNFENQIFDSAIAGFFISHLEVESERNFFNRLKNILRPKAEFLFIDSVWSKWRSQYREKEGLHERTLNDGRKFTIYKRYFDRSDVERMFKNYLFNIDSFYIGDAFLVATGENHIGEIKN